MRILLLHQYFLEKNQGGGTRFNEMTQIWSSQGHKVSVLSGMVHFATGKKPMKYKGKHFFKDDNFYNNVDVLRCHVSESYNVNFLGRLWGYFSFVFSSTYAGLFKLKKKHDVLVVSSPPLFIGIAAILIGFFKRIPVVFEVRDLWPESAIDTGVLRNKFIIKAAYWFETRMYKYAKIINVLTPAFRDKLIEKGVPEEKIIFIPNAADFTYFDALTATNFNADKFKEALGFKDKFVITYVGAHGVANHLIQLIEAAELLRETPVIFQFIGSGMEKEMLKKEALERNLENVTFTDFVPKNEIFKYILSSDMGASILKNVDTFKTIYSNKTFDYMSCKKPVLLAIDGVSRELIEKADCGIFVQPENPEAIANGILNLLSNRDRVHEMGINGYEYAKKHFDRKEHATRYLKHLESILK